MEKRLATALFFCILLFMLAGLSTQSCRVQAIGIGSGWEKAVSNPVLNVGSPGAWDDEAVADPCVIKDVESDTYLMWYSGYDGSKWRIGLAESIDGILWAKYPGNPVLAPSGVGWESQSVLQPWVIKDEEDSSYKMWYTGYDGSTFRIGLARSSNKITWTRAVAKNPVLSLGTSGQPDDVMVLRPTVIKDAASYKMWYAAYDGSMFRICMAYSGDGGTWSKYDGTLGGTTDVVLNVGSPGSWDDGGVYGPAVLKSGDIYIMWYTASDGVVGPGHEKIGLAFSLLTGTQWTKNTLNPVLGVGGPAAWDSYAVNRPCVIQDRLDFKMWYNGYDGSKWRIGYAENFMRAGGMMGLIDAPISTVYYIYPDYQGAKPAGTSYAWVSDWTALGMVIGMSKNLQYITTDTHTDVVGSDGGIVLSPRYSVVTCGGPVVNGPTKYYETTAAATPAYFKLLDTTCYFYSRATGAAIPDTAMSASVTSTNQDMFIIMAFKDTHGRHIVMLYGYGWKGSYAAAAYFKYAFGTYIPLAEYAYYIFKWTDANGDLFVDLPEISPVAAGN